MTNNYLEPLSFTITDEPEVGVDATCSVDNSDGAADGEMPIAALEEITFDYLWTLDGIPADGTNTVEVIWWGGEGQTSVTEDVVFEERDTSFDTVNIGDDKTTPDNGYVELGTAQWGADGIPAEFNYTLTQADLPVGECTSFTNTAMIAQTEQSAEATVEICPEPAADPESTPTPTPGPDPTPTPSGDPVVPVQAETNGLPKTGMDAGGLVAAVLLFIGAGGAAVMIRRKVRN